MFSEIFTLDISYISLLYICMHVDSQMTIIYKNILFIET